MKSDFQARTSTNGESSRNGSTGAMPYMSKRQTQAYLMARDTIRRIQRTSSIVSSISRDAPRVQRPDDGMLQ